MKTSAAQLKAQAKYDKKNTKQIVFKLNMTSDADILEKLNAVDNRQGYIKSLIRQDLRTDSDVLPIESIRLLILPVAIKYGLSKIYLFGSYARGEAKPASDIDLLIEGGNISSMYDYNDVNEALKKAFGKKVDLVMARAIERDNSRSGKRFKENFDKEKILIYESKDKVFTHESND